MKRTIGKLKTWTIGLIALAVLTFGHKAHAEESISTETETGDVTCETNVGTSGTQNNTGITDTEIYGEGIEDSNESEKGNLENAKETIYAYSDDTGPHLKDISQLIFTDPLNLSDMINTNEHYKYNMIDIGGQLRERGIQDNIDAVDFISKALRLEEMGDFEKVLNIHDFILYNLEYKPYKEVYSYTGEFIGWETYSQDFKDIFPTGEAVCEGYALMFKMLLDYNGIPNEYMIGEVKSWGSSENESERHAWNTVSIDNKWYNVDITWDDGVGDDIDYGYYLINDTMFSLMGGHIPEVEKIHSCTSSNYNEAVKQIWLSRKLKSSDYIVCDMTTESLDYAMLLGLTALQGRRIYGDIGDNRFYIITNSGIGTSDEQFAQLLENIEAGRYGLSIRADIVDQNVVYELTMES